MYIYVCVNIYIPNIHINICLVSYIFIYIWILNIYIYKYACVEAHIHACLVSVTFMVYMEHMFTTCGLYARKLPKSQMILEVDVLSSYSHTSGRQKQEENHLFGRHAEHGLPSKVHKLAVLYYCRTKSYPATLGSRLIVLYLSITRICPIIEWSKVSLEEWYIIKTYVDTTWHDHHKWRVNNKLL